MPIIWGRTQVKKATSKGGQPNFRCWLTSQKQAVGQLLRVVIRISLGIIELAYRDGLSLFFPRNGVEIVMALVWPILWFSGMLAAVTAFFVTIYRQNKAKKAGAKLVKERQEAMAAPTNTSEGFPEESFDFPEEPLP